MENKDIYLDEFVRAIRSKLHAARSLASVAANAGLHRNALYGFQRPDWNPKLSTLRALDALDILEKERG